MGWIGLSNASAEALRGAYACLLLSFCRYPWVVWSSLLCRNCCTLNGFELFKIDKVRRDHHYPPKFNNSAIPPAPKVDDGASDAKSSHRS